VSDEILFPVPPAINLWDVESIAAKALAVLRLGSGDVDADRVREAAQVACDVCDYFIDAIEPLTPTPNMIARAVQVTCEEYRRPGVAWGIVGAWSQDEVAFRVSSDPLAGVVMGLVPEKQRFGIG
jgi:hypothetical protein